MTLTQVRKRSLRKQQQHVRPIFTAVLKTCARKNANMENPADPAKWIKIIVLQIKALLNQ